MAETEETTAQRQARIRQAKREAKLKASAQDRLDKITRLSGRTPESMQDEPPRPASSSAPPWTSTPPASVPTSTTALDPNQTRMQEEYLKALLGHSQPGQAPGQDPQPGVGSEQEDAMLKMLQSMMGTMGGDPNVTPPSDLPFSPEDLSKATGLPPFLTSMFMGGKMFGPPSPPTAGEVQRTLVWKTVHVVFALLVGIYTVLLLQRSTSTFGENPPAPATVQNPFLIFLTGELLLFGSRSVGLHPKPSSSSSTSGPPIGSSTWMSNARGWMKTIKDVTRDGAIVVFLLGSYTWVTGHGQI